MISFHWWSSEARGVCAVGAFLGISCCLQAATITVTNASNSGPGTLRQAILEANLHADSDTITFSLPPGSLTITLESLLPALTSPVVIDGFTQSGSSANTLANGNNAQQVVRLQGSPAAGTGLTLEGTSNVVRGIIFTGFAGQAVEVVASDNIIEGCLFGIMADGTTGTTEANTLGVFVRGSSNRIGGNAPEQRVVFSGNASAFHLNFDSMSNVVQGCYVGTDISGVGAKGNRFGSIGVDGTNNVVGGTVPGARNVICGNGGALEVRGFGHTIQGNFIGTDVTGTNVFGNFTAGINLQSSGNLIGGATAGAGNLIVGTTSPGPGINLAGDGNVVQGNFIGTDATGRLVAGNTAGIVVAFNSWNVIGGTNAGQGNLIAYNGAGVLINSGVNNAIRGNSIHSNTGRGIGLGGVLNVNDPGDGDFGPNELQNFPVITNAAGTASSTTIQGFLSSKADTVYQLDFFSSVVRDVVNRGEGQKYLGSGAVLTDNSGTGVFSVTVSGVMLGRQISATATDPAGNTSEFSDCFAATSSLPAVTNIVVNTADSGPGSFRQALVDAGTHPSIAPNVIVFGIPGAGPHTIRLLSALAPPIEWVAIEGFSQPGSSPNTSSTEDNAVRKIILDGTLAGSPVNGLTFEVSSNRVRGLVIQGFYGNGVALTTNSSGNLIEGCFITGNTNSAVLIDSANNLVGGTTTAARNLLSGNDQWGVTLQGNTARSNVIAGNLIGPDSTGENPMPNRRGGVLISDASSNTIGGSVAGRNIISGNTSLDFFSTGPGIQISGAGASNNVVQGNIIGASAGEEALGNKGAGVLITSFALGSLIGAPQPPAGVAELGNVVAFNGNHGVDVQSGDGHVIRGNRFFENNGLGINLGFAGNPLQVAPVLSNATVTASNLSISGSLKSKLNSTYSLDFYSSTRPDRNGRAQAEMYLGSTNVTTDASGNASFNVTFPVMPFGEFITATATDETSTLSTPIRVEVDSTVVPITVEVHDAGDFAQAVDVAEGHPGLDYIVITNVTFIQPTSGYQFNSPVHIDGGGVVFSGAKMTGTEPLLSFNGINGNTLQNLTIVSTPGDAVTFNASGGNRLENLNIGGAQPIYDPVEAFFRSPAVRRNAISWLGIPINPPGPNYVRHVRLTNIRGTAIESDKNIEIGDGVEFASVSSLLSIRTSAGPPPAPPTIESVVNNGDGTVTATVRMSGQPGQRGEVSLYYVEGSGGNRPDSGGRRFPSGSASYTITSGNSAEVSLTVPLPPYGVGLAARQYTNSGSSPFSAIEQILITTTPQAFSSANNTQSASTREPVNLFTGEYFDLLPPDLDLGGPMPLVFQRYYASLLLRDGQPVGTLGNNWRHNFEWTLTNKNTTVEIVSPAGRVITFTNDSFNFRLLGRQDIPYQLMYFFGSGDFVLGDPVSQTTYRFDINGKLSVIADGRGNSQFLNYNANQLTSVGDGLGRTLTLQYSPSGFLTNVSDGTRSVGFVQSNSNLVQSVDALGKVSINQYSGLFGHRGLLTQRNRPLGNTRFTQTYDFLSERVSQQQQSDSFRETRFTYGFNMCVQTDPDNFEREFYHDEQGNFTGFADEAGIASTMTYNSSGQPVSITDRRGLTTQIAYHAPSGQIAAVTNADGSVIQFAYASRDLGELTFYDLKQVTFPDGTTEIYAYDTGGNVTAFTDRAGKVSRFSYNARGQLLTATNPTGGVVTFTYNADGTTATARDSETGVTSYFYDGLKRLTNVVHPDGGSRRWQFDANDRLLSMTDERTNTTSFAYDANDRLAGITDANGETVEFGYDDADRVISVTDSAGNLATIDYDRRGHVATATDFGGNPNSFSVDSRHRLAGRGIGLRFWQFGYNNEAQLTSVTNDLDQADTFTLDELGFSIGVTNPLGHASAFVRDIMGRLTNSVDALGRTRRYTHDARSFLVNATVPVVGTATFARNDLGLLSRLTGFNGEQWHFGYSPMGRIQFVADPLNRTNVFGYDNRGRQANTRFADGTTLTTTFDSAGNVVRGQFSAGPDLVYTYDNVNRLRHANDVDLAYDSGGRLTNTLSAGVDFGASYNAAGHLASVSYGGVFTVTYTYNSQHELIGVNDSLTGTFLQLFYDQAGRLLGINRPNGVNTTYTYDAAGRLVRIRDGTIADIQYALDAAGQVVMAGFTAPLDPSAFITSNHSASFAFDAAHQITSPGFSYDAQGRLIASPGMTYTWDGASRLTGIGSVALGYNGLNDLVTRTENGVTTRFFRNYALGLAPIVAERDESTLQVQRYYVYSPNGRLLYLIDAANGNAVRHFHVDRVGSTLALTSAAGALTDAYAYTPYGELLGRTGTSPQPFTYIGAYGVRSEPAANLYQMRARYYDPVSARFLSRDPIWPRLDGLDPYDYAAANPLINIDPLGLEVITLSVNTADITASMTRPPAAGLADHGTRLMARFNNIPSGIQLSGQSTAAGPSVDGQFLELRYTELFPQIFRRRNTTLPTPTTSFTSDAPVYPVSPKVLGVPFQTTKAATQSNLLFPFVTGYKGFDTGLAIANTSQDPFGVALQTGTCTINYFGTSAPALNSIPRSPVPLGGAVSLVLSTGGALGLQGSPNFQGYLIAQCTFQYAHGFAFISDSGASRLAEGYLALVLDKPPSAPERPVAAAEPLGQ